MVRFLAASAGIRQFVDVGTGLPTMQNTHAVAREVADDARTVYVDNDPLVLRHAQTLLGDDPLTTYVHADYHEPDHILAAAAETVDSARPVAIMFMGVMGYEPDLDVVRAIVGRMTTAAAPRQPPGPLGVDPGLVPITQWQTTAPPIDAYGAVARKP